MSTPTFAIVGHPNKGKSSLVATLARDASIRIGPEPGTTVYAREFPMRVRAKVRASSNDIILPSSRSSRGL